MQFADIGIKAECGIVADIIFVAVIEFAIAVFKQKAAYCQS
jgi:hypothetical protein